MNYFSDWITVCGGASNVSEELINQAYAVGSRIAFNKRGIITGATTGIPLAAVIGLKKSGGVSIGFSPAKNESEHLMQYKKPIEFYDFIIFTGSGFSLRSSLQMLSTNAYIFLEGEHGTLNEFTSGWMYGNKVIGILNSKSAKSRIFRTITEQFTNDHNNIVIFSDNPEELVDKVCFELDLLNSSRDLQPFNYNEQIKSLLARANDE